MYTRKIPTHLITHQTSNDRFTRLLTVFGKQYRRAMCNGVSSSGDNLMRMLDMLSYFANPNIRVVATCSLL